MRVLVWSEAFWPSIGGVQVFLAEFIRRLRTSGHDVLVITADFRGDRPADDEFEGVPVRRVPLFDVLRERRPEALLQLKRSVARMVTEFRPDITHLNLLGPGSALLLDSGPLAGKLVVTVHATFERLRSAGPDTLFGRTLERASWIAAGARPSLDRLLTLAPALESRASVIPLGVDVPEADPPPAPFSPPILLCVGRIVHMKGFDVVLDALPSIRRAAPDVRLIVAGDGPDRQVLETKAAALGVSDCVDFVGWQAAANVFALMEQSTLCVMPSRETGTEYTEGIGLVALESAARGRVVVASRVGGLVDAIVDGVTGVLVTPDDPAALAQAIGRTLADRTGTEIMGRAARARVSRHFRWDACFDAYHALFLRLSKQV